MVNNAHAQPLLPNAKASFTTGTFGREQQPLLMIDDALVNPDGVVDLAARQKYAPIGAYYPGIRTAVPAAAARQFLAPMLSPIMQSFGLQRASVVDEAYLSIVTTPPGELVPPQRLPHFDGTEPERLAVLLYLARLEQGGTAFYRHTATGYESLSQQRLPIYRTKLEGEVRQHGLPPAGYFRGGSPLFEQTHVVEGRYNRAIVYRGNTLHCGLIGSDFVPNPDPRKGRLTLNLFLR